jgi:hypothetical protein
MAETSAQCVAGPAPFVDPQIMRICWLLFHRAIGLDEAAWRLTELEQRRQLEFQAGWVVVEGDVSYEILMQADELEPMND